MRFGFKIPDSVWRIVIAHYMCGIWGHFAPYYHYLQINVIYIDYFDI